MTDCFQPWLNGTAAERPLDGLLRSELRHAAKDGVVAAVAVVVVLLWLGAGVTTAVPRAIGAFVLGVVLHELLLVAGVAVVRLRARRADAPQPR